MRQNTVSLEDDGVTGSEAGQESFPADDLIGALAIRQAFAALRDEEHMKFVSNCSDSITNT